MCKTALVFLFLAIAAGIFSALYANLGPVFEVTGVGLGVAAICAAAVGYRRRFSRRRTIPVTIAGSVEAWSVVRGAP